MSKCPECGSDCNERDELTKAEREIERLTQRCVGARNALNAALHGDGALIDDLETAVANACVRVNRERLNTDLRIAATNVVTAFEQLGKAQHATELLMARSRCETVMVKLSEALKAYRRLGVRVELAVRPDELSKGENDGPQTYLPQLWQRKRDSH